MIELSKTTRALASVAAAGLCLSAPPRAYAQPAPTLAPGVQAAKDLTRTTTRYVVANGTPIYKVPAYAPGQETGEELRRGDHPQILGEANLGGYLLVGRNGVGIGYVPRDLMCPVDLCPNVGS